MSTEKKAGIFSKLFAKNAFSI